MGTVIHILKLAPNTLQNSLLDAASCSRQFEQNQTAQESKPSIQHDQYVRSVLQQFRLARLHDASVWQRAPLALCPLKVQGYMQRNVEHK